MRSFIDGNGEIRTRTNHPPGRALAQLGRALGLTALLGTAIVGTVVVAPPAGATGSGPFAYVANEISNTVSVIDTATNTVSAIVGVGSGPLGVAITPDGTKAYVANAGSNTVGVIDTATNTV